MHPCAVVARTWTACASLPKAQQQQLHWRRSAEQRSAVAAAGKQGKSARTGGKGFGRPTSRDPEVETDSAAEQQSAGQQAAAAAGVAGSAAGGSAAQPASAAAAPAPDGSLPAVDRSRVLAVCTQVSAVVTAVALGLRQVAPAVAPAAKDGNAEAVDALLNWATLPSAGQVALAAAVAAGVTAARTALLAAWPDFRQASERSNQQVLSPLSLPDLLLVGGLPAVSEELLFRGALIPAIYPDWRGVVIAGVTFGVLHNSGGRNPAFAAWAAAVGCAYGALFLATGSVACPALAHTLANVASAALWKAGNGGLGSSSGGSGGSSGGTQSS